jgi:hypothetical protein
MTNETTNTLLAPRFLFRFAVPVRRHDPIWTDRGVALDDSYRLPDLAALDRKSTDEERRLADVRMAWSQHGLAFWVSVDGKSQAPWCRESRLDESDGLQVWIDTRATHNIHRASRFCHRFAFLPAGGGQKADQPVADQLLINRARENARPIRPRELQVVSKVTKSGYQLAAFVPAVTLGGFDPEQHPRLGFTYAVFDRERGLQTFATGPAFPFDEDPSCWATVELID